MANKQSDEKQEKIHEEFLSSFNKLIEATKKKDQVIQDKIQNTKKMHELYFSKINEKRQMKISDSQKNFNQIVRKKNSISNRKNSHESNQIPLYSSKKKLSMSNNEDFVKTKKSKLNADMSRKQMNSIICKEAQEYNMAKLSRIKNLRKKQILEKFTNLKMKLESKKKEDDIYNSNLRKKEFELHLNNKISMHQTAKIAIQKQLYQDQCAVIKDKKKNNTKNHNLLYSSSSNNLE